MFSLPVFTLAPLFNQLLFKKRIFFLWEQLYLYIRQSVSMTGAYHVIGGIGLGWMASKTETGVIFEQLKHIDYRSKNPGAEDQALVSPQRGV